MRCPKCGAISFDYLKQCGKCGKDISDVSGSLGIFYAENDNLDWFKLNINHESPETMASEKMDMSPPEIPISNEPPKVLEGIDISDLVDQDKDISTTDIELNPDDLKDVEVDENFNDALDKLIE